MTKLPDFIIIGASKCGTTSLFHYLSQHSEIYMCPKKETFFFLDEESRLKNQKWGAVNNFEEYKSLFADAPQNAIVGEISTTYYSDPNTAKSIHQLLPNTKIIAILRDPAARAFSDYLMHQKIDTKTQDFGTLIDPKNYYIKMGFYHSQLINYYKIFDKKKIKILLYEDLLSNPREFVEDLFSYLGVATNIKIDMTQKYRESGLPNNKILYNLFIKTGKARNITKRMLAALPQQLSTNLYEKIKKASIYKPTLSTTDRAKLIEIYRPEILQLQDLIDRDLSMWLSI